MLNTALFLDVAVSIGIVVRHNTHDHLRILIGAFLQLLGVRRLTIVWNFRANRRRESDLDLILID